MTAAHNNSAAIAADPDRKDSGRTGMLGLVESL